MKTDILAFGAHPDDVELSCAGTILQQNALGKKTVIADLTRGELGTRGTPEGRIEEANAAAAILGVEHRENLGMRDGFFTNDAEHQLKIIEIVRKYKPDVVLCNADSDRHIDHGRAGKLVEDACFLSGLRKIETTHNGEAQQPWRPRIVLHYIQDHFIRPHFVVDVTPYFETKLEAIKAFKSQFFNPGSKEPVTPISVEHFLDAIRGRAFDMGRFAGVKYAEGFTCSRPMGIGNLADLF